MRKTFKIRVRIRNCDVIFKEGMDPGVLGFRELTYDLTEEDYKSPRFASALVTERDEILKDLLTVEVQEAQFEEENKSEE